MVSITEINPNSLFVHLQVRSEKREDGKLFIPGWYNCAYRHAHAPIDFDAEPVLSAKQASETKDDPFLFQVEDTEIVLGDNLVIRLKDEHTPEVRTFICTDDEGEGILVIHCINAGFRVKDGGVVFIAHSDPSDKYTGSLQKVPFQWINVRISPQSLATFTRGD